MALVGCDKESGISFLNLKYRKAFGYPYHKCESNKQVGESFDGYLILRLHYLKYYKGHDDGFLQKLCQD